MRLLYWDGKDEPYLIEANSNNIPPYAILSHTWAEGEEVLFADFQNHTAKTRPGYRKIRFCAEQARQDNIFYFWVDTCCIDKTKSAELSENINSMYQFYQNAVRCYAYLTDVTCTDASNISKWQAEFQRSRWFTRGWTLQELIAPANVAFFSSSGAFLGDKSSLGTMLSTVTRIPVEVLCKTKPLAYFDPETLFGWMDKRDTLRPEDQSYALLGMFDVHMEAVYGEGGKNARERLKDILDRVAERSRVYSTYVGGIGGANFSLLAPLGQRVQELHMWSSKQNIQAIRVKYTNGQEELVGQAFGNSAYSHFVFNQDERITRLMLWDNHDGCRLGGIGFTTTDNRSLEFGKSKNSMVEWENRHFRLVGVCGTSGQDINRLAFIFSS